jgi:hypothetical protein
VANEYLRRQVGYPVVRRAAVAQAVEIPPGLPTQPMPASQPQALGQEPGQIISLPGVNYPPAGATPVDELGDAQIGAGLSALLLTVTLPDQQRFRMAGIGFGADDETALAFLSFTIFAGPFPVPGYINKRAAIGTIQQLTEIFILTGSSLPITVVGTADPLAVIEYRFLCRVRGWYYFEKGGD